MVSSIPNNNARLVIGLTGGIGSGKSEVTRRFAARGVFIVDADEVAREVVLPGQPALAAIAEHFGPEILSPAGALERGRLRDIIFNDPAAKEWLESLLHPLINQVIRSRLSQFQNPYAILASPLLLETQQHTLVDRILVIDTTEELQLARATERDANSAEQIRKIIATQISRADRLARADDVIHNVGSLDELDAQIETLHQYYLSLTNGT